jgi:hypothetical protein
MLQFAIHKPAHHTQIKINSLSYCENIICRQLKAGIFISLNKKREKRPRKNRRFKGFKTCMPLNQFYYRTCEGTKDGKVRHRNAKILPNSEIQTKSTRKGAFMKER